MKKIIAIALVMCVTLAFAPLTAQVSAKAKTPAKVSEVKLTDPSVPWKKPNTVNITWNKANGASKYEVHQLTQKKGWRIYKVVKKTAKNKKKYTVKDKYKVKRQGKRHYRVYKFAKKWYLKKKIKATSFKIKKLASGKTYKFKVRGVKGKKCGKFSGVVSVYISKKGAVRIIDSRGTTKYYETLEGHDFMAKAKRHVGGKYKVAGRHLKDPTDPNDKNSIDCTGLVQELYLKYVGLKLPGGKHSKMINYALKIGGEEIESLDKAAVGDLIFYHTYANKEKKKKVGQHVAIYAGNNKVLDACSSRAGWENPDDTTTKPVKLKGVYIRSVKIGVCKMYKIIRLLNTQAEESIIVDITQKI